jgi:hypothetical protein
MLEKLKEYKELITIIVFFLGGFIWLNNQFPTKKDLTAEIGSLICKLEKYMTLTQLQIHVQELDKQAKDLTTRFSDMETNIGDELLSPAMKFEFDQIKSEIEHNIEKKRSNEAEIEKILDELARHICER